MSSIRTDIRLYMSNNCIKNLATYAQCQKAGILQFSATTHDEVCSLQRLVKKKENRRDLVDPGDAPGDHVKEDLQEQDASDQHLSKKNEL